MKNLWIIGVVFFSASSLRCSSETQADEMADCTSQYVGDSERVKICAMPKGVTCYLYNGTGVSCIQAVEAEVGGDE